MEKHYTVSKTRPGADCGSDHELLIAKFRLKLKKVGKTTRRFSFDLNQIPYNYTVEVRNRFKGLDLIDRVPDELLMEVRDIVQETRIKTITKKKKWKKGKWLSEILQDRYYCPHFTEKEIECKQVNFLGSQREKKNDKTKI